VGNTKDPERRGGYNGDEGLARETSLDTPNGLAVDGKGQLHIADTMNHLIRKYDPATDSLSTVIGKWIRVEGDDWGYKGRFNGIFQSNPRDALLSRPWGLGFDQKGNLYITENTNNLLRRWDSRTGALAKVAGKKGDGEDGSGGGTFNKPMNVDAHAVEFCGPMGVAANDRGVVLADTGNNVLWLLPSDTPEKRQLRKRFDGTTRPIHDSKDAVAQEKLWRDALAEFEAFAENKENRFFDRVIADSYCKLLVKYPVKVDYQGPQGLEEDEDDRYADFLEYYARAKQVAERARTAAASIAPIDEDLADELETVARIWREQFNLRSFWENQINRIRMESLLMRANTARLLGAVDQSANRGGEKVSREVVEEAIALSTAWTRAAGNPLELQEEDRGALTERTEAVLAHLG
jgi:hypothetical protein